MRALELWLNFYLVTIFVAVSDATNYNEAIDHRILEIFSWQLGVVFLDILALTWVYFLQFLF